MVIGLLTYAAVEMSTDSVKAYSAEQHALSRGTTLLWSQEVSGLYGRNLQLPQERKRQQRLEYTVVTGRFPAIPAQDYITRPCEEQEAYQTKDHRRFREWYESYSTL